MKYMEEKFKELLKTTEVRKVDFKQKQYLLDNTYLKSKLVKDILCMANAPGGDGHILLGVKSEKGKPREVIGISHHHDSSDLEQIVDGVVAEPIQFEYYPVQVKGKSCALLHIPQSRARPHRPKKAYGVLVKHIFYTRRASGNTEASLAEIREMILSSMPLSDIAQHKLKSSKHIVDELVDLSVAEREADMHKMFKSIAPKLGATRYHLVMNALRSRQICSLLTSTNRRVVCDYAAFMYPWVAKKNHILSSRHDVIRLGSGPGINKISHSTAERLESSTLIHIGYKAIYTKALVSLPHYQLGYWFANQWNEPWGEIMKWEDTVPKTFKDKKLEFKKRVKYEFFLPNVTSKAELRDRLENLLSWVDNNIG